MATISCPGCGAAAAPDAAQCDYCTRPLARIACGGCLARLFPGMAYCPFCGEAAAREAGTEAALACPACADAERASVLWHHDVGGVAVAECRCCHGIWLDPDAMAQLERERAARAPFAAGGAAAPEAPTSPRGHAVPRAGTLGGPVRYRRCPVCATIMNRENVARISGVVVDRCRDHGVFFDVDELQHLVAFWESGGTDRARRREREHLALERRRLEALKQYHERRDRWGERRAPARDGIGFGLLELAGWSIDVGS